MKKSQIDLDYEKVLIWLTNPDTPDLSDTEKRSYEIMTFAANQLRHYNSVYSVVVMLQRHFKLSRPSAYNYINNAKHLFGATNKLDKDFERLCLVEMGKKLFLVALKTGDIKEANKVFDTLCKHLGFSKEDTDLATMADLEPKQIYIQLNVGDKALQMNYNKWQEMNQETIYEILSNQVPDVDTEQIIKIVSDDK